MEMTPRERVLCALEHRKPDRVPIQDSPWATTVARWHREGLPEGVSPVEHFGYAFRAYDFDISFQLPEVVLEETDEYRIVRNSLGATVKNWKNATSTPGYLDFAVKDRRSWEEYKPLLSWNDRRIDWASALARFRVDKEAGWFCHFAGAMGYDRSQGFVGSERLLMAMLDDPAWVRDIFAAGVQLLIDGAEEMLGRGFDFDGAFLYDDMGYRNGPLFSPQMYRELLFPFHKKIVDFFHGKGLRVILHSCGCVKPLIPDLIKAGFDCLQPLEVKAGMDLIELKRLYGERLAFMGGIDVRLMALDDLAPLEKEISTKFAVAKSDGAYIYHSDHSVPDDVSFANYCRAMELVEKYGDY
ncbi:MAG: hypothetical protein H5U38_10070 [Calditrichaeota bacterium]|nr:hypothetical protein [Calditrichota bacterium]